MWGCAADRYDPSVSSEPTADVADPADDHSDELRPHGSPPAELVTEGRYNFGTYDGPIELINPLDVVTATGPAGRAQRAVRNGRLKEWEAFQLGDDDWFVLGAVYDTKSLSLLQVLVVNKAEATIRRYEARVPTPAVRVARGLDGTVSRGRARKFMVQLTNEIANGVIAVDASHPGRAGGGRSSQRLAPLELHGVGRCGPGEAAHLVIVHPFTDERALYSHKVMMPFAGTMRLGYDVVDLAEDRSFMILDDHHGDYPAPMRYDWVTGVRRTDDGVVEGFNLTDNQIRNPERFNENAVWIGDRLFRLPPVRVDRPEGPWGPWIITDRDGSGSVDVRFTPTVRSELHVGPRHLLAEYYAPYGWYEGRIHTDAVDVKVDGIFGVGEQKLIRV